MQCATTRFSILVMIFGVECAAAPPASLLPLEPKVFDQNSLRCEVRVRVDRMAVAPGESFMIECELSCSGGGEDIYNPFLWSRYRLPVRIVIASADGAVSRIV